MAIEEQYTNKQTLFKINDGMKNGYHSTAAKAVKCIGMSNIIKKGASNSTTIRIQNVCTTAFRPESCALYRLN